MTVKFYYPLLFIVIILLSLVIMPTAAQEGCGITEAISYPIDTNSFMLVQDFGVASQRHQGRFHLAEDWFGGRGSSYGQPVRAAASGVVTYSSPLGWGRNGGVIIIRHTFADESVYYSLYGHLMETDDVKFPNRLECIDGGDLLGFIGNFHPAPHLHFEMRVNNPDIAGAGYSHEDPESLGWRRPRQVIANLQARLNPAHLWHVTGNEFVRPAAPLLLNDNSLLVIDGRNLRRITSDGRIWWRTVLGIDAVSVSGYQGNAYITYENGTTEQIIIENGSFGILQRTDNFTPDSPPLRMNDGSMIYHTSDNTLVALTNNNQDILWRLDGIANYDYGHVGGDLIALVQGQVLWLVSLDGRLLGQSRLSAGANLSTAPDGTLVAYTRGGLWRINAAGHWSEIIESAPPGGGSGSAIILDDGRIYLFDGKNIYAYTAIGELAWQAQLPQEITGKTSIDHYGNILLITGNHGHLVAIRDNGGICGFTRLYGDDSAKYWHDMGNDGVLRVSVGDQMLGLDWQRFIGGC